MSARRRRLRRLRTHYFSAQWLAGGWLADLGPQNGRRTLVRRIPSPNYNERPSQTMVSLLIVHAISLPPGRYDPYPVKRFFLNRLNARGHPYFEQIATREVSSHFYIGRDGAALQFVATEQRAWHAGESSWQGRKKCNDYTIGVELAGSDTDPFRAAQYRVLRRLISVLRQRYPNMVDIAGHYHIAPGRKRDPGPCFSWHRLLPGNPRLPTSLREVECRLQ